ncbi:hypothetical protein [Reichenbachiella ulvae]|uniref:Uncharacterized protein n=1 Tax=Reichenbachiella ulvae TaxID=2980104 RepID=A0ABT3CUW4_9BACT|nr:hypothetical protein [Reichenbachiella ulvae]MCV9387492.1 hypothetical protein [Reichenbachiella ulvae]
MSSRTGFTSQPWDTVESTYRQEITLKNGKWFPGYSKRVGMPEAKDKVYLLKNMILRMYKQGYLDETNPDRSDAEYIEYFWKNTKGKYVSIFRLYQDVHEWTTNTEYRSYLEDFLNDFYRLKSKGLDPYSQLYISKRSPRGDYFDLDMRKFYNYQSLRGYCLSLIKKNIKSHGEVKQYYIKYAQKWLDGYRDEDERFFENLRFG